LTAAERQIDRHALIVGAISLDVLEHKDEERIRAGFGGVAHNFAFAASLLGVGTVFVSPLYEGDLGAAVKARLARAGVRWHPLDPAPLAHFFAEIEPDGSLGAHRFVDNHAFDPLTPATLSEKTIDVPDSCAAIGTCTDLSVDALQTLRRTALSHGIPFWLIASDQTTSVRASALEPRADVMCLNSSELAHLAQVDGEDVTALARAALSLVGPTGVAAVTMGARGALLVDRGTASCWYQPQRGLPGRSSLGAGDVFAAALLAADFSGCDRPGCLQAAVRAADAFVVGGGAPLTGEESLQTETEQLREPERIEL
jgi:sugar/nucleoside kinase (ribokinase family)